MSSIDTESYALKFTEGVQLLAEQQNSRLFSETMRVNGGVDADGTGLDEIENVDMNTVDNRFGDTQLEEAVHRRKWLFSTRYDKALGLDKLDKVRQFHDFTNPYTRAIAGASARKIDDTIIAAFDASVTTGKKGTGSALAFDSTNYDIAHGSTGLTVAKVIKAREILSDAEEGSEKTGDRRIFVCAPEDLSDMLDATEVKSHDYNKVKALVEGELDYFCGFHFVELSSRRLPLVSNARKCFAFVKSGMYFDYGEAPATRISERADKKYTTQVYHCWDGGAVRRRQTCVVRVNTYHA